MINYNLTRSKLPIFLTLMSLNACTIFRPYVDISPSINTGGVGFPKLCNAIENTEKIRKDEVLWRRNEITGWQGGLKLTSFAALSATGVGALYSASSSLLLGLGTAGVGSYVFGSTFFGDSLSSSYQAANTALACVSGSGNKLLADGQGITVQSDQLSQQFNRSKSIFDKSIVAPSFDFNQCSNLDDTKTPTKSDWQKVATDWIDVQASNDQVKNKVTIFMGRDTEAAQKIDEATRKIIDALNANIKSNTATYADIVNATKNISSLIKTPATGGSASKTSPNALLESQAATGLLKLQSVQAQVPPQIPLICFENPTVYADLIKNLNNQISSLNDAIDKTTNEFSALGDSCSASPSVIAPITAKPTKAVLSSSMTPLYTIITLSGGKPPFKTSWKSPVQSNLSASFTSTASGDLIISGTLPLPKDGDYTLTVTDDQSAPQSIDITVTTVTVPK